MILAHAPEMLDVVWELNGHTLLLQAVFYNWPDLVKFALERRADTSATTVRGLAAMELARQFQNQPLIELIGPYDRSKTDKAAYYERLLQRIAPLPDRLISVIDTGLQAVAQDAAAATTTLRDVCDLVERLGADVNALGGPLQQPPLVAAVTGNNGTPPNLNVAELRKSLVNYLLEKNADPTVRERHPMGVGAVIRAAVFNHLELLEIMARKLGHEKIADALNEQPSVNGLTALHDTVLRASTAAADQFEGYLDQIRWCVKNGARSDIEDFSGRTQRQLAEAVGDPQIRQRILDALGLTASSTTLS
jgi:ankyrin repeat protein